LTSPPDISGGSHLSETHVYVRSLRFAHVATRAS
jgi:hypothetical protein